jgi:hypothetical protein
MDEEDEGTEDSTIQDVLDSVFPPSKARQLKVKIGPKPKGTVVRFTLQMYWLVVRFDLHKKSHSIATFEY